MLLYRVTCCRYPICKSKIDQCGWRGCQPRRAADVAPACPDCRQASGKGRSAPTSQTGCLISQFQDSRHEMQVANCRTQFPIPCNPHPCTMYPASCNPALLYSSTHSTSPNLKAVSPFSPVSNKPSSLTECSRVVKTRLSLRSFTGCSFLYKCCR
jgi:hypothetical protein